MIIIYRLTYFPAAVNFSAKHSAHKSGWRARERSKDGRRRGRRSEARRGAAVSEVRAGRRRKRAGRGARSQMGLARCVSVTNSFTAFGTAFAFYTRFLHSAGFQPFSVEMTGMVLFSEILRRFAPQDDREGGGSSSSQKSRSAAIFGSPHSIERACLTDQEVADTNPAARHTKSRRR